MNAAWYRYGIGLGREVRLGRRQARFRRGYILRLETEDGRVAAGEAAPIDGFGRDTEAGVRATLGQAARTLTRAPVPSAPGELRTWMDSVSDGWPATVRFAAESALMYLASDSAGVSPGEWLGGVERPLIDVCALASNTDTAAAAAGVIKVKVGSSSPEEEGRSIAALLSASPAVRVRADANRAWSTRQSTAFVHAFCDAGGDADRFDFLEEPLRDSSDLVDFAADCPLRIALDETVLDAGPAFDPSSWSGIRDFVLKPSLFGGLTDTLRLADRVQRGGGRVIFSSAFESGLGLSTLAWLAGVVDGPAAGFGTARYVLNDDVPMDDALLDNPVALARLPWNPGLSVRFESLEAIDA